MNKRGEETYALVDGVVTQPLVPPRRRRVLLCPAAIPPDDVVVAVRRRILVVLIGAVLVVVRRGVVVVAGGRVFPAVLSYRGQPLGGPDGRRGGAEEGQRLCCCRGEGPPLHRGRDSRRLAKRMGECVSGMTLSQSRSRLDFDIYMSLSLRKLSCPALSSLPEGVSLRKGYILNKSRARYVSVAGRCQYRCRRFF